MSLESHEHRLTHLHGVAKKAGCPPSKRRQPPLQPPAASHFALRNGQKPASSLS
ncbi:hypothetical protein TIFTF001_027072 [Ficus carica]|uniref:Uncharacterized protein n=1 Tax=Ficus carica TaxID=3494 RepID=A0AA88IUI3_FICCA|nr:hypothetical protein TIFTF001_027072 [Ficus carica]